MFGKLLGRILVLCLALVWAAHGAKAADRCDIVFANSLDREIVSLRVRYADSYDGVRNTGSRVFLSPGKDYRIGVQGVRFPEALVVELATASYEFADLSGLKPDQRMFLTVGYENGAPRLTRTDGDGAFVAGIAHDYLSPRNKGNAVDRDFLTDATTMDQVRELVEETVREQREERGEEAASLEETLFAVTDPRGGTTLRFPVFWKEQFGVAQVAYLHGNDPKEGIAIVLYMPLPDKDVPEVLDELLSDLRVDGFRPLGCDLWTRETENREGGERQLSFLEGESDKYDDYDAMLTPLADAYEAGAVREATSVWIKTEAFDKKRAGEEVPAMPGVGLSFSQGTFVATFIPDATLIMP